MVTIGSLEVVVVQHLHHQITLVLMQKEDLVVVDEDLQIHHLHYQHQEMKWMQSQIREVVEEVYEVLQKKRIVRRFDGDVGEYLRKFAP